MTKTQIKKFAKWLRVEGSTKKIRESSIKVYCESLNVMVKHYKLDINTDKPNIRGVVTALNEGKTRTGEPLSAATLKLRKATLKYWMKYKGRPMTKSITDLLKTKSGDKRRQIRPKDLLTILDVEDIIENTESQALRALIACLWDLGCRPSEITGLDVDDLVPDDLGFVITIRRGKSSKGREVRLLTPLGILHLKKWLEQKPDTENPALFLTNRGKRYNPKALTSWLVAHHQPRQRARRKMPKWNLNPYLFRKSRTTQLLKERRLSDIEIKLRLGHTMHSNVLETYYAILDEQDQANAERRYIDPKSGRNDYDIFCPRCKLPNEADAPKCVRCGMPLTEDGIRESESKTDDLEARIANLENLIKQVANGQISQDWLKVETFKEPPKAEQERVQKELEEQIEAEDAEKKAAKKDGGKASESPEVKKLKEQTKRERSLTLKSKKKRKKKEIG